jgi:hypothetical protein
MSATCQVIGKSVAAALSGFFCEKFGFQTVFAVGVLQSCSLLLLVSSAALALALLLMSRDVGW